MAVYVSADCQVNGIKLYVCRGSEIARVSCTVARGLAVLPRMRRRHPAEDAAKKSGTMYAHPVPLLHAAANLTSSVVPPRFAAMQLMRCGQAERLGAASFECIQSRLAGSGEPWQRDVSGMWN